MRDQALRVAPSLWQCRDRRSGPKNMIVFLLAMMVAADPPVAMSDTTAEAQHWGKFGRAEALSRRTVSVLIGTLGYDRVSRKPAIWMRREQSNVQGNPRVDWADSRTCPAMVGVLTGMRALPRPEFQPPGIGDDDLSIIMDGVGYSLTAPAGYGDVLGSPQTISSNVGTPLAQWVDASLAALTPCWRDKPPLTIPA